MKLNVKLFEKIRLLSLLIILGVLLTPTINAIIATGNTTVDGTTRDGEITDFTQTQPYIIANRTTLFVYAVTEGEGIPILNANANMTINNTVFNLTYSPSLNTYNVELYFNATEAGDYQSRIQADKAFYDIPDLTTTYYVVNFVSVCFNIWKEKNKTKRYDNDFSHLFVIPHNKSSSLARMGELAYPFEYMNGLIFTKINRYTFFPTSQKITSLEAGFHKEISTTQSTCIGLPRGEPFTARIIQGRNLNFFNSFFSKYQYESIQVNTFLLTETPTEDTTLDVHVTDFDINPFVAVIQVILWILAIAVIFVIPITIALRQGKPREAGLALGALVVVIPIITYFINKVVEWLLT